MGSAQAESPQVGTSDRGDIHETWSRPLRVTIWLIPEDEHWAALVEEFDVVGMGATQDAAILNMEELLRDYFKLIAEEGRSVDDARRPISIGRRLMLQAGRLRGVLASRIRHRPSIHRLPREARC